ncbi:hypothetical protein P171DRAFT_289108 [Karstenula rhodostoma CBS 690.94]|uniref:Uncharacterized protein n=1 Tax=Karstenula rhodostoma CBS 690.94 TaxID=1392251 RepID=A0A9P4PJ32_9PLEO|nr:hypothetical protein P171DRAFT_289108 [Karstenula rhodostoma CBS 690.94]
MLSLRTSIIICAFLAVCTLAWDEDIYYPPFLGPILDLFFDRDPYDPLISGSGYTLFIDDNWKMITGFFKFLINMFFSLLLLVSLPPLILFIHLFRKSYVEMTARDAAIKEFQENGGSRPPRPNLQPTRDTRYMTLGGDGTVIWVCGVGGGFEDVFGGDIEGAIARRWQRMGRRQFV